MTEALTVSQTVMILSLTETLGFLLARDRLIAAHKELHRGCEHFEESILAMSAQEAR